MKHTLLIFLTCFSPFWSFAQITITNSVFPQAGYQLTTASTTNPLLDLGTASSTPQVWDYSLFIPTSIPIPQTIQAASSGNASALFPSADILLDFVNAFGTSYVDVRSQEITKIGAGFEIANITFINPYINPHTTQKVPLDYLDVDQDKYKWSYGDHIDSVPFLRALLDSMVTIPNGITPDSIRIAVEGDETRTVDAFGTCILPDSSYDVLRQKIESEYEIKIEVYVPLPFIGGYWFDATPFLQAVLPIPTTANELRYYFWAQNVKQPLVSVTMIPNNTSIIQRIEYAFRLPSISLNHSSIQDVEVLEVYPNPASSTIFVQSNQRDLDIKLLDATGKSTVDSKLSKGIIQQLPVEHIPNGLYFLKVNNSNTPPQKIIIQH